MTLATRVQVVAWRSCAFLAQLLTIVWLLSLAFALADLYAVVFRVVSPGDHMFGDRTAPSITQAFVFSAVCAGLLWGSRTLYRCAASRATRLSVATAKKGSDPGVVA
jgi:hypothetical protein